MIPYREIACERIASEEMPSASMWEMMVISCAAVICSAAALHIVRETHYLIFMESIQMKCVIMPDLTVCAEEFLEEGVITHERMRAVDAKAQALGITASN